MLVKRLLVLAIGALSTQITVQKARHPLCLRLKCIAESQLASRKWLFCGGCQSYPSSPLEFSSLQSPHRLLDGDLPRSAYIKTQANKVLLAPKKFGFYDPKGDTEVTAATSAIAERMMDECKTVKPEAAFANDYFSGNKKKGGSVIKLNHLVFIPIKTKLGVESIKLKFGSAFSHQSSDVSGQELEWSPTQLLKEVGALEKKSFFGKMKATFATKSFLVGSVAFDKSTTDLYDPDHAHVNDVLPAQNKQHDPALDILDYTVHSAVTRKILLPTRPTLEGKWVLACDGYEPNSKRNILANSFSWKQLGKVVSEYIARWKRLAEESAEMPGVGQGNKLEIVVAKRNNVISHASSSLRRDLMNPDHNFHGLAISSQCRPAAARYIQAFTIAAQSQK